MRKGEGYYQWKSWARDWKKNPVRLLSDLSPRQRVVLTGIANDKTRKQLALEMNLNLKTVDYHILCVQRKCGIQTVSGLTLLAIRLGVVPCPCDGHRKEKLR